jgi:deazaflavin-dependent oxidoreductase (nitroreductase family)
MPLSRRVARFNERVTNRLTRPLVPHLPWFGLVVHRGRTSGREYRTPVNVFERGGCYVIALTYGASAEWVKNVLADGGCELITRGRRHRLAEPELVRDEARTLVPAPVRPVLRAIGVTDFLRLRPVGERLRGECDRGYCQSRWESI